MTEVKLKNLVCIEMQTTAASQVTKSQVKRKRYTKVKTQVRDSKGLKYKHTFQVKRMMTT